MKNKIQVILGIMIMAAIVMAISNTESASTTEESRWTGAGTPASDTTEGGNVTGINLATNDTTDKWAAYFGNVTARIVLTSSGSAANAVYNWTWSVGASANESVAGDVCASTGSAYAFATVQAAVKADIDTRWSFTDALDADQATDTFTDEQANCALTLATATVVNSTRVKTGPGAGSWDPFRTCAYDDGATAAETDFVFCSQLIGNMTSPANASLTTTPRNFRNESANFEIMVPTSEGSGTETYYFYVELQ